MYRKRVIQIKDGIDRFGDLEIERERERLRDLDRWRGIYAKRVTEKKDELDRFGDLERERERLCRDEWALKPRETSTTVHGNRDENSDAR